MKTLVTNYAFNASAKTVTFNGYSNISLASILLITNTTNNTIIYNFADPALGGTVTNNVLTLTYNTTTMSNTDSLQIYYDDVAIQAATVAKQQDISDLVEVLHYLTRELEFLSASKYYGSFSGAQGYPTGLLVYTNGNSNLGTVSNVSNVSSISGMTAVGQSGTGGQGFTIDPGFQVVATMRTNAIQSQINNIVVT